MKPPFEFSIILLFFTCIILAIILLFVSNSLFQKEKILDNLIIERNILLDGFNGTEKDGIYFLENDYYCVNIKNRHPYQINETESHEYCHHLIQNNYAHFCE